MIYMYACNFIYFFVLFVLYLYYNVMYACNFISLFCCDCIDAESTESTTCYNIVFTCTTIYCYYMYMYVHVYQYTCS